MMHDVWHGTVPSGVLGTVPESFYPIRRSPSEVPSEPRTRRSIPLVDDPSLSSRGIPLLELDTMGQRCCDPGLQHKCCLGGYHFLDGWTGGGTNVKPMRTLVHDGDNTRVLWCQIYFSLWNRAGVSRRYDIDSTRHTNM